MQSIKWPGCAAQIHVQCQGVSISNCLVTDILQPVENLKATFSTTHIKFQWKGPGIVRVSVPRNQATLLIAYIVMLKIIT